MFRIFLLCLLVACEEKEQNLQYYTTCGDPVCEGYAGASNGISVCSAEEEAAECSEEGGQCDLENDCNQRLICTNEDPATECPVSKAKHKRDIVYVSDQKAAEIASAVKNMKIAEWNYNRDDSTRKSRLGFMIDDNADSPAVLANGERVDLYGYTSMAVIALQQQAQQIQRLETKIAELEARLEQK